MIIYYFSQMIVQWKLLTGSIDYLQWRKILFHWSKVSKCKSFFCWIVNVIFAWWKPLETILFMEEQKQTRQFWSNQLPVQLEGTGFFIRCDWWIKALFFLLNSKIGKYFWSIKSINLDCLFKANIWFWKAFENILWIQV